MKEYLIVLINGLIFLLVGILCLFFPGKIQEYVLKDLGKEGDWFYPFVAWVKTPIYIYTIRGIGVMALIIFGLVLYVVLFKK